jgi:hypothetical protein
MKEQSNGRPDSTIITSLKELFSNLETNKICFLNNDAEDNKYNIINKTEFYKNILLNPSSHDNREIDIYKEECKQTITLLEELNNILATITR